MNANGPRIAGFICNWGAYSGLEMAGVTRRQYPANLRMTRVPCLGRLHAGLLLRAFELGADGVLLLGCPPEECHFQCDGREELVSETRKLLRLLGIEPARLALIEVPVGRDDILVQQATGFVDRIERLGAGGVKVIGGY